MLPSLWCCIEFADGVAWCTVDGVVLRRLGIVMHSRYSCIEDGLTCVAMRMLFHWDYGWYCNQDVVTLTMVLHGGWYCIHDVQHHLACSTNLNGWPSSMQHNLEFDCNTISNATLSSMQRLRMVYHRGWCCVSIMLDSGYRFIVYGVARCLMMCGTSCYNDNVLCIDIEEGFELSMVIHSD